MQRVLAEGLRPLLLRRRELLPIVQGGMGVGVSAHRLASAVAREDVLRVDGGAPADIGLDSSLRSE